MAWLGTAIDVRALADGGMDLVNVETGEFYSFSRHMALSDRVAGLYGTVPLDELDGLRPRVTSETGAEEFMGMVEDACQRSGSRLVPRYVRDDGHAMSIKEAARISHGSGWSVGHPAKVFDEPGLGRAGNVQGPFGQMVERFREAGEMWATSTFADCRRVYADMLEEWGFDPAERGNPLTSAQRDYMFDLAVAVSSPMPVELADMAAAGALSSHEAARAIEAAERSAATGEPFAMEPETGLSEIIEARHDAYAESHGGFMPAGERGEAAAAYDDVWDGSGRTARQQIASYMGA